MLGDISLVDEIYIVCGYTDMRKSIDGLCAIVENQLHMNPRRSALYLFCGRRCDCLLKRKWQMKLPPKYWMNLDVGHNQNLICGYIELEKMVIQPSSYMDTLKPDPVIMQRHS